MSHRNAFHYRAARHARGATMIGLLVTMVMIVVLFAVLMSALNKTVTGEGESREGTVRSAQDEIYLYALYQGHYVASNDYGGSFPTPAIMAQRDRQDDITLNTTANHFSAMIAHQYIAPDHLIAANEFSHFVLGREYDYTSYSSLDPIPWDQSFWADLDEESNVSWAHMPLYGERLRRFWNNRQQARMPIFGNRGPKDGVDDPSSLTYGRHGRWGGHMCYADGSIKFLETFTPPELTIERGGEVYADNIFAMEEGPNGEDAIISVTKEMTESGPVLQWD